MKVWVVEASDLEGDTWIIDICASEERAHQAVEEDKENYRLIFEKFPHLVNRNQYEVYSVEVLV